jgi:hypothetical protein
VDTYSKPSLYPKINNISQHLSFVYPEIYRSHIVDDVGFQCSDILDIGLQYKVRDPQNQGFYIFRARKWKKLNEVPIQKYILTYYENNFKIEHELLTPKVLGVFPIKRASKQTLLKARWIEQNWVFI